jgi:peptidoglycan hydrolase FlgJ
MSTFAPIPLHSAIREANLAASGGTTATSKTTPTASSGDDPRLKEAAVQFEAVFVRQMLSCLEKAAGSPMGNQTSGGSIYGSMVVNSVADAVAHAGGLGLSSMLMKSLSAHDSRGSTTGTTLKLDHQDAGLVEAPGATSKALPDLPVEVRKASLRIGGRPP